MRHRSRHTDNWSNEDHLLFLKVREKCCNIPALVVAIQAKCPDLTAENIVNHEAWYKIYLNLREKQRSTVKEWRKRKEMEKKKKREDEAESEILDETSQQKIKSNMTKKHSIGATNKCETIMKTADIDNANRKKELIKQWKIEKENKRLMQEKQSKILTESKLAAEEKRQKERSKRIQEALTEYHKKKSMEISSETKKDDSKAGQKYNPTLVKAFRRQDEEYTNKKKNLIAKLQRPAKNQMEIIVRSHIPKMRDNSTLLNPTKVWSERCKMQDVGKREPRKLQYIKDVPRLYVQWRNKESMTIKDSF